MSLAEQQQTTVRNRILKSLPPNDFARLQPHLELVTCPIYRRLIIANVPIAQLYFPETGFASITTVGPGKIELGLIGREGLVGAAPVLLGSDCSPFEHFIQSAGEGFLIGIAAFQSACLDSSPLRTRLLRYVQTLLVQTAQTAFANAACDVEARLARWLLMCQDRLGGNELALTHGFLSMMLGVQRTSVTLSLQSLEGSGLIRARRGRVEIRDRERLIVAAGDGYGIPEAEYARLLEL